MSSTDSPVAEAPAEPTEEQRQQAALREAYETTEGIRRLLRMVGVKSLRGNLEAEDEAVRRDIEKGQELYGIKPSPSAAKADEMDVMAARDVIVNHYTTTTQATQAAEAPQEPTTMPTNQSPPTTSTAAKLGKAALIAAAIGGGPLTAVVMNYLAKPAVVAPADPIVIPKNDAGFVPYTP
jgi:hypothetical protein